MELNIQDIQKIIPHRYPFLLIDKIVERDEKHIVGIKNVTINEPFFQGHFPEIPIMPGVLIVEAMAQASGILFISQFHDEKKRIAYFAGIDKARFRKPVTPGDQLRLELNMMRIRKSSYKVRGTAHVDGELVAEAELLLMVEIVEK